MYNKLVITVREVLGPRHYLALLISLLSLTIIAPLVDHDLWTRVIVSVFLVLSLLTATMAVNESQRMAFVSFFLVGLSGIMWTASFMCNIFPFNTAYFQIFAFAVTLLFFITIANVMWRDIFSGSATANRICGAVCLYLLIGFCFAMLHSMVALNNPSAYKDSLLPDKSPIIDKAFSARQHYPIFMYFSFCTLSTVGYGDIVPVSRLARSIAWIEAVTGQLYLAILVARLVGMHIMSSNADTKEKSREMARVR
jgi:hypothetical protein